MKKSDMSSIPEPLVSIIIITCNRPFLLDHCLQHVFAQSYQRREIIVVDSSTNNESELVVAQYSEIKLIRLRGQHNNMPHARNSGVATSCGEIIAFIDDDAMVQPGWLEALVAAYCDETVGGVGGRVISMPEPYCDQFTGSPHLVVNVGGRIIGRDIGCMSTETIEVDHLIGCNMSFRRMALEQAGRFDTNYTLTNLREETDMCIRVKQVGWRLLFVPAVAVLHFSSRSLNPYFLEQPVVQFSNGRNSTYFAVKHFGITPHILLGQLLDSGKYSGRALYHAGCFCLGAALHLVGRVVGFNEGIKWRLQQHLSSTAKETSEIS